MKDDYGTIAFRKCQGRLQGLLNYDKAVVLGEVMRITQVPELIWCESSSSPGDWVDIESLQEVPEPLGAMLCAALGRFWPLFALSHPELRSRYCFHPELEDAPEMTFYGGSFDPFHPGHLACIKLCPARPLIVIPDHNPQKPWRSERSFWQLYQEIKRQTQGMEGVYVYPGLCGDQNPTPTINWIRQLGMKKNLLLGDDSFMDILQWQQAQILLRLLNGLHVAPRLVEEGEFQAQVDRVLSVNHQLKVERHTRHCHESLSSSQLRQGDK